MQGNTQLSDPRGKPCGEGSQAGAVAPTKGPSLIPFLILADAFQLHWEHPCSSLRPALSPTVGKAGACLEKNVRRSRNRAMCQLHRDGGGRRAVTHTARETGKSD